MAKKKSKKKSGKKPLTVGVIGLGRSGWNIHVRGLRENPAFQIVAVADLLPERLKEAQDEFDCSTFKDLKSMLKGCDKVPDLIIIANRTQDHVGDSITAMKAGAHVLVEKPCGQNPAEVRRMIAASKKTKRKLFMHHNYRLRRDMQYLFEQVKSSPIGPIFEIRLNILGYARRVDWQTQRRFGGGLLGNHGTHYIDVVLQLLGAPVTDIFCDMKHICDVGDCEDHCKIILRAANGRLADISLSTSVAQGSPPWSLYGKHGSITIEGKTARLKYYNPKKVAKLKVDLAAPTGRKYGTAEVLPWVEKEEKAVGKGIGNIYDNIVSVLRNRGKMYVTPESVLEVVKVLDRCRKQNPKFK